MTTLFESPDDIQQYIPDAYRPISVSCMKLKPDEIYLSREVYMLTCDYTWHHGLLTINLDKNMSLYTTNYSRIKCISVLDINTFVIIKTQSFSFILLLLDNSNPLILRHHDTVPSHCTLLHIFSVFLYINHNIKLQVGEIAAMIPLPVILNEFTVDLAINFNLYKIKST